MYAIIIASAAPDSSGWRIRSRGAVPSQDSPWQQTMLSHLRKLWLRSQLCLYYVAARAIVLTCRNRTIRSLLSMWFILQKLKGTRLALCKQGGSLGWRRREMKKKRRWRWRRRRVLVGGGDLALRSPCRLWISGDSKPRIHRRRLEGLRNAIDGTEITDALCDSVLAFYLVKEWVSSFILLWFVILTSRKRKESISSESNPNTYVAYGIYST